MVKKLKGKKKDISKRIIRGGVLTGIGIGFAPAPIISVPAFTLAGVEFARAIKLSSKKRKSKVRT